MRWSVYFVTPAHALIPLGRVNAPDHTTALVRALEKWPSQANLKKPHLGLEVRKWKGDPHPLGKRYRPEFTLVDETNDEVLARQAAIRYRKLVAAGYSLNGLGLVRK